MLLSLFISVIAFVFVGCDPDTTQMRLLVYDKTIDSYALEDVEVETLKDVSTLSGDATVIEAGLSLKLNYDRGNLDWQSESNPVAFSSVKKDGVLIPSTFDSLAMASIYYHMELSYLFYKDDIELPNSLLKRLPTYYNPEIVIVESGDRYTMTDNAFYMKISRSDRGFFIVPFEMFQWIPIALNTGIITHEFSHYVFDKLLQDNLPELNDKSMNFLRSYNEAFADYMAVARTEDPDFMAPSIPPGLFVTPDCNALKNMELTRNIADPIEVEYSEEMDDSARVISATAAYCPYQIGLQLAGMFYQMAVELDKEAGTWDGLQPTQASMIHIGKRLVQSMDGLSHTISTNLDFELWEMFTNLVESSEDETETSAICGVITDRYAIYASEVNGC